MTLLCADLTDIGREAEVTNVDLVSTNHAAGPPDIVATRRKNRRSLNDRNQRAINDQD